MNTKKLSERLTTMLKKIHNIEVKIKGIKYHCFILRKSITSANYFDIRGKKISCNLDGCVEYTDNNKWARDGRSEITIESFLLYHVHVQISLNDVRIFDIETRKKVVKRLAEDLSAISKGADVVLNYLTSLEVGKIYNIETSPDAGDYLKNSCMRPESTYTCRKFAKFYTLIPDCSIIYGLDNNNYLLYRALLWQTDKGVFLDRIYGSEIVNMQLIDIAIKNGWMYRNFNDSTILFDGTSVSDTPNVKIPSEALEYLENEGNPYIDTMEYIDNLTLNTYKGVSLQVCDGDALHQITCPNCGNKHDADELIYIDGYVYCENCVYDNYSICDNCGGWVSNDDRVHISQSDICVCSDCAERNYCICDDCGEYHRELTRVNDGSKDVCEECLENYYYCDNCDEYFDETFEHNDGYYCQSCYDEIKKEIEETIEN